MRRRLAHPLIISYARVVQLVDTPDASPVSIVATRLIVLVRIQPRAPKNCNDYKWPIRFCDELLVFIRPNAAASIQ
jgi:hypothetical protein